MGKRGVFQGSFSIFKRLGKNKRGVAQTVLLEAMQAVAVILVLTGSLYYVNTKLAKVGFFKSLYARDTGMQATTMYAAPGNIYFLYYVKPVYEDDADRHRFTFQLYDNFVRVNATGAPRQSIYWYFSTEDSENITYSEGNVLGLLTFVKEGSQIEMGKKARITNANKITCPKIKTEDARWRQRKIILDAAHGEEESERNRIALSIAESSLFPSKAGNVKLTRKETGAEKSLDIDERAEIIGKEADEKSIVISISIGKGEKTGNYIKAYYNINSDDGTKQKSRKLGCTILNKILEYEDLEDNKDINGAAVMPSDSEEIEKILPRGKTGVVIELGNIDFPRESNFLYDTTDVVEAVYFAIEEYFGEE